MTPSTCSEDLLALQESSNENNSADQNVSPENQKLEIKRETPVDIQSNDAFFSTYEGSLMNDNNLGGPTEYINASHFPDQNTHYSEYDQNYANPNYLMNPYSTSMPSPAPAPNFYQYPTSIPFANDTENSPSNNNYVNDDNELNNDQLNFGNSSDLQNYDYYANNNLISSMTSLDKLNSIPTQEEKKMFEQLSGDLSNVSFNNH